MLVDTNEIKLKASFLTDRIYRKRYLPHEAIEIIMAEYGKSFDPQFAQVFLDNIAPYPVGTRVILNNGVTGFVKSVYRSFPARPVIQLCQDMKVLDQQIDLVVQRTIFIQEVLS